MFLSLMDAIRRFVAFCLFIVFTSSLILYVTGYGDVAVPFIQNIAFEIESYVDYLYEGGDIGMSFDGILIAGMVIFCLVACVSSVLRGGPSRRNYWDRDSGRTSGWGWGDDDGGGGGGGDGGGD